MSSEAITVIVVAVLAAGLTFALVRLLDRLTRRDAETEGRRIIEEANRNADNRKKEAELEAKEMSIQQKAEGERELGRIRQELHERERLLESAQDAVEQQADHVRKQEKMVEATQRKLAERIEDTNRRNEDLQKLLDLQRQTLHQLSGLGREEATRRLLEMLDQELEHEQGAVIQQHERKMHEICEVKSREILVTAIHAMPPHTLRKPPPVRSIFLMTK